VFNENEQGKEITENVDYWLQRVTGSIDCEVGITCKQRNGTVCSIK